MSANNTKVSILATSTPVLTTAFRTVVLANCWVDGIIWLRVGQVGDAVVGEGIPLIPATAAGWIGGSFTLNDETLSQNIISAISSTGTNLLSVYSL